MLRHLLYEWFMLFLICISVEAIPKALNYQGKLLDTDAVGINDTLDITFALYSSEIDETSLWSQTINDVVINLGLFSVELTDFPDTVDFSSQYYLELRINGEILSPREKLSSSPYSIHSEYTTNALQSIYTSANPTRRNGEIMFVPGSGTTLSESGDSIIIAICATSSGVSVEEPLSGTGIPGDYLKIDYDDISIGKNMDEKLFVKDDGITSSKIANGTIIRDNLSPTLQSDLDDAVTLNGYTIANFASSSGDSGYIQNQTDSVQSANFNIDGNGYFGGNVGIGTSEPNIGEAPDIQRVVTIIGSEQEGGLELGTPSEVAGWGVGKISFIIEPNTDNQKVALISAQSVGVTGSETQGAHLRFFTKDSSSSTLSERMRITSNGQIGIGTTSPDAETSLHIKGSILTEMGASTVDSIRNKGFYVWYDEAFGMELHRDNIVGRWGTALFTRSDSELRFGHYPARETAQSALSTKMVIKTNGDVGIGTLTPSQKLEVAGNIAFGDGNWQIDTGSWQNANIHWVPSSGNATFGIHGTSGAYVNFYCDGSKSFQIPHPLDPENKELVHASLEGPEVGVYYRGESECLDGEAEITLPDYFEVLTRLDSRTALVTPKFISDEPISALAVSEIREGKFKVRIIDDNNPNQKFYWEVKAVRNDIPPLETVIDK